MKPIARSLAELIEHNELLQFGLYHRLFNLSQLSRFLHPQVEARAKRTVEVSALTMALSRVQRELRSAKPQLRTYPAIANMTVHSKLLICVYPVSKEVRSALNKLYNRVHGDSGYITISEGISECSVITAAVYAEYIEELLPGRSIYRYENVSSLAVKFHPTFFETAGVFYSLVQQLYFQNINILEMASAGTEFILYFEEQDVRLAFDTIYRRMSEA